jgi:purine-cytosine permease-like protein
MAERLPHPYAICAIWLLGTMLPFAFLTILGDASADALGATAIVSMVPEVSSLGMIDVLALYILQD